MEELSTYEKTLLEDLDKMNYELRAKTLYNQKLIDTLKEKDEEIANLKKAVSIISQSLVTDMQNENKKLY